MVDKEIVKKLNRLKAFCGLALSASWNNYELLKVALQCEQRDVALFLLGVDCTVNRKSDVIDNTPLHYAVKLEDTKLIQTLLSKRASLTCQNQRGDTPLHLAAMSRNTAIVDLLLQNLESTRYANPANKFGLTHMHIACMRDKPDIVNRFLISGVKKDVSVNLDSPLWPGYTPLHFAVEFCCLDVVQLLMKHRFDGKYKDAQGTSPYDLSYYKYQNASMINFFMHKQYLDSDGPINFHVACLEGNKGIVEKYLKHGAMRDGCKINIYKSCIYELDKPLHCAARSGSAETVKLLLKYNADIHSTNNWDMTPLHVAFYMESISDFQERVFKVLYSAYNFKDMDNLSDDNRLSFFHIICSQGNNELIEYLLKKDVEVDSSINYVSDGWDRIGCEGYTPLHFAIQNHHPETVKLLLQYGVDITRGDETPLECAISFEDNEIIEIILEGVSNLSSVKIYTGENPFHILLKDYGGHDCQRFINILYEKGCNVNRQSYTGDTPLHNAYFASISNIKAVLDIGADINIENIKGETPLMVIKREMLSEYWHFFNMGLPYVYKVFLSHIKKLKTIGFYVSEKNRFIEIDQGKSYHEVEYYSVLQHQYEKEIEKMKQIKLTNYSSLYDILFADANRMAFHSNNQSFLDIVKLNDFDDQFPSYGYLLKLQLKKGNKRKAILEPAKKALKLILRRELLDFCAEEVLSYLSDDDLKSVIRITNKSCDFRQILEKYDTAGMKCEVDNDIKSMRD
ncbi:ankyrin-1-like [Nasonia vitripennis]|uniref:Uncharacterized protein n=1 Tax=Nasonia vitripennis TaxID=7425 RepID=A0A7M7QER8_NASVI|nr:ankyrin-1-like [Nasonia vitripennis]XP_031786480.1 ankyrin-1-like [Nasonia vitripennis]